MNNPFPKFEASSSSLTACEWYQTVSFSGYLTTNRWSNLGSLLASIALYEGNANAPYNWKIPVYTQYGMIGLCAIFYAMLPESPCKSWLACAN